MDEKVPLNLEKEFDNLTIKFKYLEQLYKSLQKKVKKQGDKKVTMEVAVNIHRLKEDMETTCENLDELLVSLDKQRYWELSNEDIKRIEASDRASELFKEFLPQMVRHSLSMDSRKDINKGCYLQ